MTLISGLASKYFIMRQDDDGNKILVGSTTGSEFTDYTTESDRYYLYSVYSYSGAGYSESNKVGINTKYAGLYIADTSDLSNDVSIVLNEDELFLPVNESLSASNALVNYQGRRYPVKESREFLTEVKSVTFYVDSADRNKLKEIHNLNGVVLVRGKRESAYFSISSFSDTNSFLDRGYKVQAGFTRVYYEGARFDD